MGNRNSAKSFSQLVSVNGRRLRAYTGLRKGRKPVLRWDLGVRSLLPEWRNLFSKDGLGQDLIAGLTVSFIAVPLSLAIALASNVPPAVGLITAIVAGIICALFGGTPLAVSGPAAAMSVLIAANVEQYGLGGLLVIGLGCGVFQVVSGVFGLGKFIRFIPFPVVAGFTAGIGAIIFIGQLPRAFGLQAPPQNHVVDVILHVAAMFTSLQAPVLLLAVLTIAIAKFLPKVNAKLPAPLLAVVIPTLLVVLTGWEVPLIGDIPRTLPFPKLPDLPTSGWGKILGSTAIVYALASLETLLSSTAVDRLNKGKRSDPDQELIGQGIGNVVVSFFGGIPVTGVIARSALNVKSGAKSRRSSIFHSLILIAIVVAFAPIVGRIPVAALAGILISVSLAMLNPGDLIQLWRSSRIEALVYAVTFFTIVFVDLIAGVQAGLVAALLVAVLRLGQLNFLWHGHESQPLHRFSLTGPLTFLASFQIDKIKLRMSKLKAGDNLILDLSRVSSMDSSGAAMLLELVEDSYVGKINLVLKGVSRPLQKLISEYDEAKLCSELMADTEAEVEEFFQLKNPLGAGARLQAGVAHFQLLKRNRYSEMFKKLQSSQQPHTLFVTCSDSRIIPSLITTTDPGELFIVRNVGNVIPPFGGDDTPAEGAAIEYAVEVLGVREIVVCGHSGCGAMQAVMNGVDPQKLPSVNKWLKGIAKPDISMSHEDVSKLNATNQMKNLLTYPSVQKKVVEGSLRLTAWFYDLKRGELFQFDENSEKFESIVARSVPL